MYVFLIFSCFQLVLDFDPDTKEVLVEVNKKLVTKLKPHQARGVKFMWDACYESVAQIENDKEGIKFEFYIRTHVSNNVMVHPCSIERQFEIFLIFLITILFTAFHTCFANFFPQWFRCQAAQFQHIAWAWAKPFRPSHSPTLSSRTSGSGSTGSLSSAPSTPSRTGKTNSRNG